MAVDQIGNIFGIWRSEENSGEAPIMLGSHIDTVINAGIYDGCYGVLAALEVIETLKDRGVTPARPIVVAAFTNEEGVRFAPDMLGSLVYAGGLPVETALATTGTDGAVLGQELARIGYAGNVEPGFLKPHAYVELHIEQGPVLQREGFAIGAVENLQGISWQRVTIDGIANHAGTTPMAMRSDAGLAAARVGLFLREHIARSNAPSVATIGTMRFEPDAINVIPSRAAFTVDLRDPDEDRLQALEAALTDFLVRIGAEEGVTISVERLARFQPVAFDQGIVAAVEASAKARGLKSRRMTSGAGHDAQMIARIAPTAMIFVPSRDGISHNPREHTEPDDLVAGANVLLDVVERMVSGR
ncbi:N-carbamoyl-L-amino-acid hydrolase [Ensifer sp. YR511]|nr:N-carbamoyl-L-amino-acid hydrolase [Ensifer sp. YR511]